MGGSSATPPPAPDWAQQYNAGASNEFEWAPKFAEQEYQLRSQYGPKYAELLAQLYNKIAPRIARTNLRTLKATDPQSIAMRNDLFNQVRTDLAAGYQLTPEQQSQTTSAIRGAQAARGNVLGAAPVSQEALYVGDRAAAMHQQRLANASGFLAGWKPQDSFASLLGGGAAPAAGLIAGNTGAGYSYVDPGAGWKGVSAGNQHYQQQLQNYGAQSGSNPWMGALGGAASGAAAGTAIEPGYGTIIGALVGGAAGYFGSS